MTSVTSSAPGFPSDDSFSDIAVNPEMSTNASVPSTSCHVCSGRSRSQSSVRRGTNGTSSRVEPAGRPGARRRHVRDTARTGRRRRSGVPAPPATSFQSRCKRSPKSSRSRRGRCRRSPVHNVAIARSGFRWSVVARGSEVVSASLDDALRQTLARSTRRDKESYVAAATSGTSSAMKRGSIECAIGDSRYRTSAPAASSRSRARRANSTRDHRVERPMADRDRRERAGDVELPALDLRDEPRQRDDRRRPRAAGAEAESERHHRALREAAEDDALVRQPVEPLGGGAVRPREGRRIGVADARHDVPVRAARRQRERAARAVAVQAALRIERVEEREEVVLVGAAPVEEHERAGRVARRGPLRDDHALDALARVRKRRQHRLDLEPEVLERRRQDQALAEVLDVLVRREAGSERRDLEQDAARLAEVDRAEPEAVDHRRRPPARLAYALDPLRVLVRESGPRDVVHGARPGHAALGPAARRRRRTPSARRSRPTPARSRASRGTRRSPRAKLRTRARRRSRGSRAPPGSRGGAPRAADLRVVDDELEREPFRIGEDERAVAALAAHALLPEVERLLAPDAEDDAVHHAVPGAAADRPGVLEERDVGAGRAELVGVEEVVDARVVLVDGLLDETQSERPGVVVEVLGRVARDARDVVDPVEPHTAILPPSCGLSQSQTERSESRSVRIRSRGRGRSSCASGRAASTPPT